MASKRPRAQYEADLRAQYAPYVVYGTPLPPADSEVRDDGSFVPVWKQEVTDERGRKRLHGAFTGGFSAGYFNTVGSKEGWTPSTFVSSRANRKKDATTDNQQRPEDFMDEEDLADASEATQIQTTDTFAGLGAPTKVGGPQDAFLEFFKPVGETIGVRLLKKMGWKEGQGIGPFIRRKTRSEAPGEAEDDEDQTHLFAPENTKITNFTAKHDQRGLGYQSETRLADLNGLNLTDAQAHPFDEKTTSWNLAGTTTKSKPRKNNGSRGAFGVGILNDTGSDDEDPYEIGPRMSYNKFIGGDKKSKKRAEEGRSKLGAPNPLVGAKPVFVSKKLAAVQAKKGARMGHDGRPPLNGFVFSTDSVRLTATANSDGNYPPPKIPQSWVSSRVPSSAAQKSTYESTADAAKASTLDPKSRASLLGEEQLPGKSVFDFLSSGARDRIANASGKNNLPAGRGEAAPKGYAIGALGKQEELRSLVPTLDKEIALKALGRGIGGWTPYAEDEAKRFRYRAFMELKAGLREGFPERGDGMSKDDWVKEMQEFAHAAQLFKPMTGMMASRFTSSTTQPRATSETGTVESILKTTSTKVQDPAEAAAKAGMYGPMTRSVHQFHPTRLLCKRFNVKPPTHTEDVPESANPGFGGDTDNHGKPEAQHARSTALPAKSLELVSKSVMQDMLRESGHELPGSDGLGDNDGLEKASEKKGNQSSDDTGHNVALEAERPGDAVFKAIFGSDDDGDDE